MDSMRTREQRDWVGSLRARVLAWDLPTIAIVAAVFVDPTPRTAVWVVSLTWMGLACLVNARRCGRRHCRYTGPFFLLMAVATLLHGQEIVSLGPHGWLWLGATLVVGGFGVLWYLPERLWGKFVASTDADEP